MAAHKVPKAKAWCEGREGLLPKLRASISPSDRVIWVHAASLGEFEQGRPIIEQIREKHPEYKILLTFYSPSGYEIRKGYEGADWIFYLPIDTTRNVQQFLDIAHPEIAIFVKYEFWLNTLFELRRRKIRSYVVSAIFRPNSIFFKPWGYMWRKALESFETIFVQDKNSTELLANIGFDNVVIAGDTRFDRVMTITKSARKIEIIEEFKGTSRLLVAGSTWQPDEQIVAQITKNHPEIKVVIAPHEIDKKRIAEVEELFGDRCVKYTDVANGNRAKLKEAQVVILDTMGMLSSLYQYGEIAYIGGGFGVGIHNTLEAATFGLPIAFGPNYLKFKEAVDMVTLGACRSINNAEEAEAWFSNLLNSQPALDKASRTAREYTANQCGATDTILRTIFCE